MRALRKQPRYHPGIEMLSLQIGSLWLLFCLLKLCFLLKSRFIPGSHMRGLSIHLAILFHWLCGAREFRVGWRVHALPRKMQTGLALATRSWNAHGALKAR